MRFTSAQKCLDTIQAGDDVENVRSDNRRKINDLFNGVPPVDSQDAEKMNLHVNVNWGEGAVLFHHARRQYYNAFLRPGRFFKVAIPDAPEREKLSWQLFITSKLNRILKNSRPFYELYRSKFAAIVAHGIGIMLWRNKDSWRPSFVAIENLRVPTDTLCDLSNLVWFAEFKEWTPGELARKVFGKPSKKGWNKKAIQKILHEYHTYGPQQPDVTWENSPERMAELYKQNGSYYCGDAVPVIPVWNLYFLDDEDPDNVKWKLRVLPHEDCKGLGDKREFLFDDGDTAVADELSEIIHFNFGDLSNKAPFMYHSVRSLGFMLIEPCYYTNLMRCRMLQHVFENFNTMFRTTDPSGRARAPKIELWDRSFIPEGVSIVKRDERHMIDAQLLQVAMAQLRQLMSEASSSYTQEIDSGTRKEQTAYETAIKASMVNAMMSGLLAHAFMQERWAYMEICRRFCRKGSRDPDVKKFQRACSDFGIPTQFLDADLWDVEPEQPLGSGNPVMEMTQSKELMAIRPLLNPTAQEEVIHEHVSAITGDPRRAERLVPLEAPRPVSEASRDATWSFATLMQGLPVRIREELNVIDQIDTFIMLMAGKISQIEKQDNVGTPEDLIGLQTVAKQVGSLIQRLAQDLTQRDRVRRYSQEMGQLMNLLKAFGQRLAEKNGQMDPAKMQELQLAQRKAEQSMQIKQAQTEQKLQLKEKAAQQQVARDDAMAAAEIQRENMIAGAKASREILGE